MRRFLNLILGSLLTAFVILMNINVGAANEYNERTKELRGAWVATVSQIDMPTQAGTTPMAIENYKKEFLSILDTLVAFNMNAIFFQVRPMNDAFYQSEINPWSRFLIGSEGNNPGWDPLAWMIEESHKRGIEFHAWLNPYRASLTIGSKDDVGKYLDTLDNKNFAKNNRDKIVIAEPKDSSTDVVRYQVLLNPGEPAVRKHIFDTIEEIITNYNVDAIHFDDYFYNDVPHHQDDATRNKAGYNPNNLSKNDWRREQVNILVKGIHDLIDEHNEKNNRHIQFGISPAPMWAPSTQVCTSNGQPGGLYSPYEPQFPCWGYYTYTDLFADTKKWVEAEWIDYIVPQNYFEFERYHRLITEWWSNLVRNTTVKLYMGIGAHSQGANTAWDKDQMRKQLTFNNQFPEVEGIVLFSYKNIARPSNASMIEGANTIKELWSKNSILPHTYDRPTSGYTAPKLTPKRSQNLIQLTLVPDNVAIGYNIYKFKNGENISFDDEYLFNRYRNFSLPINIEVEVENKDSYIFVVEAFLPNGETSSQTSLVVVPEYTNSNAPEVEYFEFSRVTDLYAHKERITIRGAFKDVDGDRLSATLEIALKPDRYRDIKINVVDNKFEQEFEFYSLDGEDAVFRLTVTDKVHTIYTHSHRFDVGKYALSTTTLNYYIYQQRQKIANIIG